MKWSEIPLGVVSYFFCCFCETCTCPPGIYDMSLLSFQNSSLLCFSHTGQITYQNPEEIAFSVLLLVSHQSFWLSKKYVRRINPEFEVWLLLFVCFFHLYFSDNFRKMTSLKILLFSFRNNSVNIHVKIRLAFLWSRISLTVVVGASMTLLGVFFFFLLYK